MIDSHAHVAAQQFAQDRDEVVARARAALVRWIEIGTTVQESKEALAMAAQFPDSILGATVGVHPDHVTDITETDWATLEKLLQNSRAIAVGEVGLDYYRTSPRDQQLSALERFVALATDQQLPVVWHVRSGKENNAHADMLSFLRQLPAPSRPRGVMHTFSGTWREAEEYLALGMYVSLSGVVTFKNAPDMHEVARRVPLDRLLIETDSPFLTPEPHRGARNEPAHVQYVAEKIAGLRGISREEVAAATEQNTRSLFAIS